MLSVRALRSDKNVAQFIPNEPGIYKWWCNKETLDHILSRINTDSPTLLNAIETCQVDGSTLFCIYVGKAGGRNTLRRRIISQHIKGNCKASTLRKTLFALFFGPDSQSTTCKEFDKKELNDLLDTFLWNGRLFHPKRSSKKKQKPLTAIFVFSIWTEI